MSDQFIIDVKVQSDVNSASKNFKKMADDAVRSGKNITKGWDNIAKTANKAADDMAKKQLSAADKIKKGYGEIEKVGNKIFGPLGLSLGIGTMISQAHQMNQTIKTWHNNFRSLSDATGDTTAAVKTMGQVWSKSTGSLAQIQSNMSALGAKGLPVANKQFKEMAIWVTNMSNATGIGAETFVDFTVGLQQLTSVSLQTTAKMTSALIALGDGFEFTNVQIESVMKSTQSALSKISMFFDNVDKSMHSMTLGIGAGTAAFKKMNISVETAGNFFNSMLDPEKMNENMVLFSRLGISYGETMDMMSAENGQEMFFDKLMTNLPALSRQITSLKNPMARLQFSKSLGLPLEIAQKMAKGTAGEIQTLMADYKVKAKEQEANTKKQEKAKADAARFDEAMMFLKMKALMPIMNMVQKLYPAFSAIANSLATAFASFGSLVAQILPPLIDIALPTITGLLGSISKLFEGDIAGALGSAFSGLGESFVRAWSKSPAITMLLSLIGGYIVWSKINAIRDQFAKGFERKYYIQRALGVPMPVTDMAGITGSIPGGKGIGKFIGPIIAGLGTAYAFNKMRGGEKGDGEGLAHGTAIAGGVGFKGARIAQEAGSGAWQGAKLARQGFQGARMAGEGMGAAAKFGAKFGGSMALKGGLKGASMAAKGIPGLGQALALAEALAYAGYGAYKGDETAQKDKDIARERKAGTMSKGRVVGAGAAAGLMSGVTMGMLDREEMTIAMASRKKGSMWGKEGYMAKRGNELSTSLEMSGGNTGVLGGTPIGALQNISALMFKLVEDGARAASGKFKSGKEEKEKMAENAKTLKAGRDARGILNKEELKELELQNKRLAFERKNGWTEEDTQIKFELKNKIAALKAKGNLISKAEKNELDRLELHQKELMVKQEKFSAGWGDAIANALAQVGSFFGMEGEIPTIGADIKNTFTKIGQMMGDAIEGMWDWIKEKLGSIEVFGKSLGVGASGTDKSGLEQIRKLSVFNVVGKDADRRMSTENVARMQAVVNSLSDDYKKQGQARLDDYVANLKTMNERYEMAGNAINAEQMKKKEEEAKLAGESLRLQQQQANLLGAGNRNTSEIAKNTSPKGTGTSQDYINFYLKNQGFIGAVWSDR